ncbi:hypothetical protein AXK11_02500 [Cephaloticoccus primus]|uniref:Uncharacterized protein n=1 Tax=Cephaloticoccus primus TaxID=1548207 RepID=A0A139SRX9_9BACT|nr:hypothetical protein AXK11_02500 [Cephaloticoccus primus]
MDGYPLLPLVISKRFQLIAVLLAAFLTTGAQWDLVQGLAWGRMFVQATSAGATLGEALENTFGGELCEFCAAVDEARQSPDLPANTAASRKADKPMLSVYSAVEIEVAEVPVLAAGKWSSGDQVARSAERGAPPSPPPRKSVA